MIVVRLYGGLGNQLFQYSTARRLAHHLLTELVLDISDLQRKEAHFTKRNYDLWRYPVSARLPSSREAKSAVLYTHKILKRFPFSRPWLPYREKKFQFDSRVLGLPDDVYLDGYWQSPKYFYEINDLLRQELVPIEPMGRKDATVAESIKNSNSVSIHVRRGDYVTSNSAALTHGTCSLAYYNSAINFMLEHVQKPKFFIFSDDPEWTRENLCINSPTEYVCHNGPDLAFQDLRLMSNCQHQIIANSTFSWWGAWLNSNNRKIIVAPRTWFLDDRDTTDIIPNDWVRI